MALCSRSHPTNQQFEQLGTAYFEQGAIAGNGSLQQALYIDFDPKIFEHRGICRAGNAGAHTSRDRARMHFELARLYAKIVKKTIWTLQYVLLPFVLKKVSKIRTQGGENLRRWRRLLGESPEFIEVMALEPRVL